MFFLKAKHHQKFVINTACGIGRKPCAACVVKSRDRFDKSDRSYRDQIFEIFSGVLIFFCNVGDQAEISFDKNVFCIQIPLLTAVKIYFFLSGSQRFRKSLQISTSKGVFLIVYV